MELDENPVMSPSGRLKPRGPTILVVGASNVGQTTDALESAGERICRAVIPGWRCIKLKIPAMVDLVRSKLDELKGDTVVFLQLFDNSFFLAQTEDGGLIPAVREPMGGKFHVHGDLVFAPKELQYSLFNMVKPILDLVDHHLKIIVSPIPRYLLPRHRPCGQPRGGHLPVQPGGGHPRLQEAPERLCLPAGGEEPQLIQSTWQSVVTRLLLI